ncbi:DUF305 domain-containing protein [Caulifigura coniformis]|nr:DUF305 domain-containing protein [Caulifigura coniformis]
MAKVGIDCAILESSGAWGAAAVLQRKEEVVRTIFAASALAVLTLLASVVAQDKKPAGIAPAPQATQPHATHGQGDMVKSMSEMNDMMAKHLGKKDPEFEKRFIDLMIPHHEGAVVMAQQALKEANRPELKKMAEEIIAAQEKEIEQLKKWRRDWYGQKQP